MSDNLTSKSIVTRVLNALGSVYNTKFELIHTANIGYAIVTVQHDEACFATLGSSQLFWDTDDILNFMLDPKCAFSFLDNDNSKTTICIATECGSTIEQLMIYCDLHLDK